MSSNKVVPAHFRRNYVLGVVNGALFGLGEALRSTEVVLSSFLGQFVGSYTLVGFLVPAQWAGSYLPQLAVCGYLERKPKKLPFYRLVSLFRAITWGLVVLAVYLVRDRTILLTMFLVLFAVHHILSGMSEVSFLDLVGKVIPSGRRGSFLGSRRFLGGILALGGSLFVRYILGRGSADVDYQDFGILFLASLCVLSVAMASFCFIVEPEESIAADNPSSRRQLATTWGLLRRDENFRRFLIVRLSLVSLEVAAPFFVLYAQKGLAPSASMIGIYLAALTVGSLSSNLIWAYLVDHRQTRLLLRSGAVLGMLVPLGAMLFVGLASSVASATHVASWLFAIVFLLLGGFKTACILGHQGFVLSVAQPAHRPTYVALSNAMLGGGLLVGSVGGFVVQSMGFEPLFLFAMISCVVGFFFTLQLREGSMEEGRGVAVQNTRYSEGE